MHDVYALLWDYHSEMEQRGRGHPNLGCTAQRAKVQPVLIQQYMSVGGETSCSRITSHLRGEELLTAGLVGGEEPVPVGQGRLHHVKGEEPTEPGLHQRQLLVGDDAGAGHLLDDGEPVREPPDDDVEVAHGVAAEELLPLQGRLQGLEALLGLVHRLALRLAGRGEDRVQSSVALE